MSAERQSFVVTIDGPAGAGKSTAAKKLAHRLGYIFLDTGALYRAVALTATKLGVSWEDGPALGTMVSGLDIELRASGPAIEVWVNGSDVSDQIRTSAISDGASRVSALPEVRAALLELQRDMGRRDHVVAEGRDVGTVVFPGADAKFFLTAPPEVRAERRAQELRKAGLPAELATVLRDIEERDRRDSSRAFAPLRKAEDAWEIDSNALSADEVVDRMVDLVRTRGGL